jgi:serine/threonine-protein kinase
MALTPGTRLGPYEIVSALGAGGMGEVYRATDTRLKRQVAIKILPASLAADRERLARFQREAEVLASLNHPNIAGIYGLEATDGSQALVMELVEGNDLSTLIAAGQRTPEAESGSSRLREGASAAGRGGGAPRGLNIDDTLTIAKQIADALEAAHEQGIIHRDLKPANIKVRADGTVKVLDFGLAKALEPVGASAPSAGANSPTITSPAMTQMGMILGTAAYMAPEQARGRAVDKRADIWAFGAVLYEMLTGTRAFPGEDLTETLAAVVKSEPDWTRLDAAVPARVQQVLRLCLQKDPKQRVGDIRDVRLALDGAFETAVSATVAPITAPRRPLWRRALPLVAAIVVTAAITGAAVWYTRPQAPALPVVHFQLTLGENLQFTGTGRQMIAISPDGTAIVYSAGQRLYHRPLSELEPRVIPGTEVGGGITSPVFSPDGRHVAFYSQQSGSLQRIPVSGGVATTLATIENPFGMTWGDDGLLIGQGARGIIRVPEAGGKPEPLVAATVGELAHGPQLLPDGRTLLYTVLTTGSTWDEARIVVQALTPGSARRVVIAAGSDARYVPTGHLVYASAGTLLAVPFDLGQLQVTGTPVTVVLGVQRSLNTGSAQFAISRTGSVAYIPGPVAPAELSRPRVLAALKREGGFERLSVPVRPYAYPRVSPDGTRVAVSTEELKGADVWILDLSGGGQRRLTTEGLNRYPVWSPDGLRVAFQSTREGDSGMFAQRADGAGAAERLTKPESGVEHIPDSWSPDGQYLAFTRIDGLGDGSLWLLSLKDTTATVLAQKPSSLIGRAAFSPDGKWLAYQSNETGQGSVVVQPFPATGAKYIVTRGGHPFWSPDGRELVINPAANRISTVSITTQPSFSFGEPTPLPGGLAELSSKNPGTGPRVWDYTPDGKRIIGVADVDTRASPPPIGNQIDVIVNWFSALRQRMTEP